MTKYFFLSFGFLLSLAACGKRVDPPAPVSYGSASSSEEKHPIVPKSLRRKIPSPIQQEKIIVVEQGENLAILSNRYGLSKEEIIKRNDLMPPYHLFPGQNLKFPIQAKPKITLSKKRSTSSLAVEATDDFSVPLSSPEKEVSYSPPVKIKKTRRKTFEEREKELEEKFKNLEQEKIPNAQKNSEILKKQPAEQKKLDKKPSLLKSAAKDLSSEGMEIKDRKEALPPSVDPQPFPLKDSVNPEANLKDQNKISDQKKTVQGGNQFIWPLKGEIISAFSPGKGKIKNDGINIAAPKDSPILAAAAGTVVYVGNEMKGFGNLILIKHTGGWMTAYGHCAKALVKPRQEVKQGEKIALVGSTGSVKTPQLHFQLRKKTTMVDPEQHLE